MMATTTARMIIEHREILWVNKISLHLHCHVIVHQHQHHQPTVYDERRWRNRGAIRRVVSIGMKACHNNHGWINETPTTTKARYKIPSKIRWNNNSNTGPTLGTTNSSISNNNNNNSINNNNSRGYYSRYEVYTHKQHYGKHTTINHTHKITARRNK